MTALATVLGYVWLACASGALGWIVAGLLLHALERWLDRRVREDVATREIEISRHYLWNVEGKS